MLRMLLTAATLSSAKGQRDLWLPFETTATSMGMLSVSGEEWFGPRGLRLHVEIRLEVIFLTIVLAQLLSLVARRGRRLLGGLSAAPLPPLPPPAPLSAAPPPPAPLSAAAAKPEQASLEVRRAALRLLLSGQLCRTATGKKLHLSRACSSVLNPEAVRPIEVCDHCIRNLGEA